MNYLKSILITVCVFVCVSAIGQSPAYKLYTIHDGLPQTQILSLLQDSRGYIWAGTYSGLACFNGVSFHTLTSKDGLPYLAISCIQEDTKGNIWFTAGRWLCKYDGQKIAYDSFNIRTSRGVFLIDKSNNFWTISTDSVPYISHNGKTWQPYSALPPSVKNLKWTSLAYKNVDSTLFMQSEKGHLLYLRNKTWHFVPGGERVNLNYTFGYGFNSFDNIFGKGNDLYVWEQDSLRFLQTLPHTPLTFPIYSTQKRHLLYNYEKGDTNYYASINNQGKHQIIFKNNNVNFTLKDKNGNIWIATEYGLMRLFLDGFLDMDKEQLKGIWGMVEGTKGTMYFGSFYQKYLKTWNGKELKEIALKDVAQDTNFSKYNEFKRFYYGGQRDNKGNVYFSMTWGILKYNGQNFSRLDKAMYSGRTISMFHYIDTVRNVLVSGTNSGVNIINLLDGATRYYGTEKGVHPTSFILGITQDTNGNYWLVSPSGVSYFDTQRDSITKTYTRKKGNFPYYSSVCATTDKKGGVWLGSAQGLLRYDAAQDTFIVVIKNDILPLIFSFGMIKDQHLVIGTVGGIYFLDLNAY